MKFTDYIFTDDKLLIESVTLMSHETSVCGDVGGGGKGRKKKIQNCVNVKF